MLTIFLLEVLRISAVTMQEIDLQLSHFYKQLELTVINPQATVW